MSIADAFVTNAKDALLSFCVRQPNCIGQLLMSVCHSQMRLDV